MRFLKSLLALVRCLQLGIFLCQRLIIAVHQRHVYHYHLRQPGGGIISSVAVDEEKKVNLLLLLLILKRWTGQVCRLFFRRALTV